MNKYTLWPVPEKEDNPNEGKDIAGTFNPADNKSPGHRETKTEPQRKPSLLNLVLGGISGRSKKSDQTSSKHQGQK